MKRTLSTLNNLDRMSYLDLTSYQEDLTKPSNVNQSVVNQIATKALEESCSRSSNQGRTNPTSLLGRIAEEGGLEFSDTEFHRSATPTLETVTSHVEFSSPKDTTASRSQIAPDSANSVDSLGIDFKGAFTRALTIESSPSENGSPLLPHLRPYCRLGIALPLESESSEDLSLRTSPIHTSSTFNDITTESTPKIKVEMATLSKLPATRKSLSRSHKTEIDHKKKREHRIEQLQQSRKIKKEALIEDRRANIFE